MDPAERIRELEAENARQAAIIVDLQAKLAAMDARLTAMSRRLFGPSSERMHDAGQQSLDLAGADRPFVVAAAVAETAAAPEDAAPGSKRRRTPRRPRVPDSLPVESIVVDVPADERIGPDGAALPHLRDEVSERLDYVPSHFRRLRIVRPVYGRPFSEHAERIVAEPPRFLVAKGLPSDALALQALIAKYADHLPLHRQSVIWARQDVRLPRSTLCGWIGAVCARLRPVWEAIGAEVTGERYLHLDDTPIRVLARDRCQIGRLWIYGVRDAVHVRFTGTRAGHWPHAFLRDYRGHVVGDAYAGHGALFASGDRIDVGCWVHVRRKFHEIRDREPEAAAMVRRIARLYALEDAADAAGDDETRRCARRQRDAIPILADIRAALDRLALTTTPRSPLGTAVGYALGQWEPCTRYATTGFLPLDNNLAENALRPVAIGRKNYLFLGSGEGGDWAAIAYSVLGSCRLNRLDPQRYLLDIAPRLVDPRFTDHAAITPRAWARAHRQTAAAA